MSVLNVSFVEIALTTNATEWCTRYCNAYILLVELGDTRHACTCTVTYEHMHTGLEVLPSTVILVSFLSSSIVHLPFFRLGCSALFQRLEHCVYVFVQTIAATALQSYTPPSELSCCCASAVLSFSSSSSSHLVFSR
jgi:hypothetical protein